MHVENSATQGRLHASVFGSVRASSYLTYHYIVPSSPRLVCPAIRLSCLPRLLVSQCLFADRLTMAASLTRILPKMPERSITSMPTPLGHLCPCLLTHEEGPCVPTHEGGSGTLDLGRY